MQRSIFYCEITHIIPFVAFGILHCHPATYLAIHVDLYMLAMLMIVVDRSAHISEQEGVRHDDARHRLCFSNSADKVCYKALFPRMRGM